MLELNDLLETAASDPATRHLGDIALDPFAYQSIRDARYDLNESIDRLESIEKNYTGTNLTEDEEFTHAVDQVETDPFVTNADQIDPGSGYSVFDVVGLDVDSQSYISNITFSSNYDPDAAYAYQVSLLNRNVNYVAAPGVNAQIEVGVNGTATVVGGTGSTLYLWHQKSLVWENNGAHNTLELNPYLGTTPVASGKLVLNLLTGQGTNPYGGTLQVSNVDTVIGGGDAGEYIVANNDGDRIVAGGSADVIIIGGTGQDSLVGMFGPVTLLVAGPGTASLTGGDQQNIYVYNGGADTISGNISFAPFTSGSGQIIDLSSVAGVASFAAVMADATQSGADTILNFGGGHTITLSNVTESDLTAADFVFQPIVAFTNVQTGEADAGAVVPITLTVSDALTVDTAAGAPTLTLSDGATATYDAAASNPSGHLLTFDYTVAAADHSPNLQIASVNANGAVIADAAGHAVDFSRAINQPSGLQIGASPLAVTGESTSVTGEADAGQTVVITLRMSEAVTLTNLTSAFTARLSDGAVAGYDAADSNPAAGKIAFSVVVRKTDHAADLSITSIVTAASTPATAVRDAAGYNADFSRAIGAATGLAIGKPLYASAIATDAATSPTGIGQEADPGQTFRLSLTLSAPVTVDTSGGAPSLTLSDGSIATYDAAASMPAAGTLVFDDNVAAGDHSPDLQLSAVTAPGAGIHDAAGHAADFSGVTGAPLGVQIGRSPLTVTNVSAVSGTTLGEPSVTFTLTMSESVTLSAGASDFAVLTLSNGEQADGLTASGNTLTFTDFSAAADAANLSIASVILSNSNGTATIQDANGYNADFSAALNVPTGVGVGDPLYITSLSQDSTTGEVDAGQAVRITLDMSEAVTVAGGTPALVLDDGATASYDAAASTPSTGALVFDYTPSAGAEAISLGINSVTLNGATVKDAGGHAADFAALTPVPLGLEVGPAVVVTAAATDVGNLSPGQATNFVLVMSQNVSIDTSGGMPTLTLSNGATATYDAALSASVAADSPQSIGQIIFDYTIGPNDATSSLGISRVNLNGAKITDLVSGAAADLSAATTSYLGVTIGGVSTLPGGAALPDVSGMLTAAVAADLQAVLASLLPAGGAVNVDSVAGGAAPGPPVAGALNVEAITTAAAGAALTLAAGYPAGYLLAAAAELQDSIGGAALVAAATGDTLIGAANDTLFGDDSGTTLVASAGAETLFGGTGANLLELGASAALADTQGADTIIGSSGSATINAAGAPLYFGASGPTLFDALGATATLVGGGAETVNAAAADALIFAGGGALSFNSGTGTSTVVSGTGGATITGGSAPTLYFGNGPSTYFAGTAVDTILGFTGSLTATGGANGTLFFTGTAGGNVVSTGGGASTIVGFGAGDLLGATGAGNDVIAASGAASTVVGTQATGANTYFAFGADDLIFAGAGQTAIESGLGNATLVAGTGSTLFEVLAGVANRQVAIGGFDASQDFVRLQGYDPGAGAAALSTATLSGGNEALTLTDGTTLTFLGVTNLAASSFV